MHPGREIKPGTIGMPVPNLECRIVDVATGEDTERGELWMRGPNIMKGYLNNDAPFDVARGSAVVTAPYPSLL